MENQNETVVQKKGSSSAIIIVLLIIMVLGLAGYICYDKGILFNNKESSTSDTNEEKDKEESITFTDAELEKYVNYISPVSFSMPSPLIYNTDHVIAKNLSTADKIKYIGATLAEKATPTSDYMYRVLSENDVKNTVEEVYGPNSYEKTTFNLGCGDYTLNEAEGKYYSNAQGCGGTSAAFVINTVIDYKATESMLEITTAYVFLDRAENKIYKNYDGSTTLDNYISDGSTDEIETYLKGYIKTNKDKLNTIVYTFESTDGRNYYFKEFTNNK